MTGSFLPRAIRPNQTRAIAAALALGASLVPWAPPPLAQASPEAAIVTESESFQLFCVSDGLCDAESLDAETRGQARATLKELQAARGWMAELGFPVARENLEAAQDGRKGLRFVREDAPSDVGCSEGSAACFRLNPLNKGRLNLPVRAVGDSDSVDTLVHEYVHAVQPARDPGALIWINEAVATAVAAAWTRKQGGAPGVYEPKYHMVLDREFHDGQDDPGYGKWDYLISLGEAIGSADGVGWLAEPEILDASTNAGLRGGTGMSLFYDTRLTGGQSFDQFFPRYVARFNNVEPTQETQLGRTSRYLYYGDIARHEFSLASPREAKEVALEGRATGFAAHPMLVSLEVAATPDSLPSENVFVADLWLAGALEKSDLSLIREHRLAPERHRDALLVDGNAPPPELGFFRVAYTPAPDRAAGAAKFLLKIGTRPVDFTPPDCFQAGQAGAFLVDGFGDLAPGNWRLHSDNGTVEGLVVTPARAGKITVSLDIDSPVTRGETGITPKRPKRSRVALGTFDVAAEDCMVRLTMGPAVFTYVARGSYTEIIAPGGEAMYFGAQDLAAWQGGHWVNVPAMAKGMILGKMKQGSAGLVFDYPGAHDAEGDFMSQMPRIWAERFSWSRLRKAAAPDGGSPKRRAAPCPDGGTGCRETVIAMDGHEVPVLFDAQGRPRRVVFDGQDVLFDYGSFPARRPPGW
ncbi:hypothetical protein [Roseovarius sp. CH_XMU1461]|uniref:hypothetical protein n=1 Tax=Roseovarius sp. CH_XMU1461 TaxID=3107777 RepID=UPI003008E585